MYFSRTVQLSLLLTIMVSCCLATTENCGANERGNPTGSCQMTCNACRDCSPCQCKPGYIRSGLDEPCISEPECHTLHFEWMRAAKYDNKKDKFFNCSD